MKLILTLVITLCNLLVFANNEKEAKTFLDKAADKFKNYQAVEVDFDIVMENQSEDIRETHSGKAFMKGKFYKLILMGTESYFDGEDIYSYMPEIEEVNIKKPSEEEQEFLNPTTIFEIHNQGFKQRILKNEGEYVFIELIPEKKGRSFTKLEIKLNKAKNNIEQVTSFGMEGDLIHIIIKNTKEIKPVPQDSFFKFDCSAHPDVEVIDLRD